MADSTLWWLLAGGLVVLELLTGTFYLLMLAVGTVAGALAAHAGFTLQVQLVTAALVGLAAAIGLYQIKKHRPGDPSPRGLRSVNLDVGEIVHVEQWHSDGTASVKYRGAQWGVILRPGQTPVPGAYRVAELVGNRLLVDKA